MTALLFGELMDAFGGHARGGLALGRRGAFPWSAELLSTGGVPAIRFRFAAYGDVQRAASLLKDEKPDFVKVYTEPDSVTSGMVLVALAEPPSDFYTKSTVHSVLSGAEQALAAAGATPYELCALCHQPPQPDVFAWLDGDCRPAHMSCVITRLSLPESDYKTPRTVRGHYATGVLGALFGAFVATLPNLSQALNAGRISSVLYAFIPLLSALCYRLFRGRSNRNFAGLVVLAASLLAAFASELFWYWLAYSAAAGATATFATSTAHYFSMHTFASALGGMVWPLLFMMVGFLPATILLRRFFAGGATGGETVRGARFVRETAFRIEPPDAEPPPKPAPPDETPENYNYDI